MPSAQRARPLIWTRARIDAYHRTRTRPSPVMVWTPEQTGAFLDQARTHPLYALFHLAAHAGLRRGEACGLRWSDLDLSTASASISHQIIQYVWTPLPKDTKTDSSERTIALTADTTAVLRAHRAQQNTLRLAAGPAWNDSDYVFTRPDGHPWHPAHVSRAFLDLAAAAGLPPIRLRNLRHGAATLHLAGGADLKVVQELLGPTTITLTADTYTSVLDEVVRTAAENAAALVPHTPVTRVDD